MSKEKQIKEIDLVVLNNFRNRYYTEGLNTENGIIADAINNILPILVELKNKKQGYRVQGNGKSGTCEKRPYVSTRQGGVQKIKGKPRILVINWAKTPCKMFEEGCNIPPKCMNCVHHKKSSSGTDYCDHTEYLDNIGCPVPYPYFFKQEYPCKGHKEKGGGTDA